MADSIYTALSGAIAKEQALEVASNNLANISTTAFKGSRVVFKEVFADAEHHQDNATSSHVQVDEVRHNFSQGSLSYSGNPLDVALVGDGFFVAQDAAQEKITRVGSFRLSPSGQLETQQGLPILGEHGRIIVPKEASISFKPDGSVMADDTLLDVLRIVDVANKNQLQRGANGLWSVDKSQYQHSKASVEAGAIEKSNINPVHSMNELIAIQRSYEMYHKSMESVNNLEKKAVNELR